MGVDSARIPARTGTWELGFRYIRTPALARYLCSNVNETLSSIKLANTDSCVKWEPSKDVSKAAKGATKQYNTMHKNKNAYMYICNKFGTHYCHNMCTEVASCFLYDFLVSVHDVSRFLVVRLAGLPNVWQG